MQFKKNRVVLGRGQNLTATHSKEKGETVFLRNENGLIYMNTVTPDDQKNLNTEKIPLEYADSAWCFGDEILYRRGSTFKKAVI